MSDAQPRRPEDATYGQASPRWTQGALGIGLALVVGPSLALFFGQAWLQRNPSTGLPVLALLGIMVLFGTLSLTSTLFRRLGLANGGEPLALPPGSVRATIALALIVLFAIIAVALLHPATDSVRTLQGINSETLAKLVVDNRLDVVDSQMEARAECKAAEAAASVIAVPGWSPCAPTDDRYTVKIVGRPSSATTDFAKTLLGLIGSLMTMAVSFYFASRTSEVARESALQQKATELPSNTAAGETTASTQIEAHDEQADGCDLPIVDPTPDEQLPPAQGGVERR